jgi:predicted nucleotidyltransferase component of viral defense system
MLDRNLHEITLKRILGDIYTHPTLRTALGFKGGTCLYLFYNLDRFSTDLDFNLIHDADISISVRTIVVKHLIIENERSKQNTWFWIGSYEKGKQKIKIEISKREYPDTYEVKQYYGLSIATMTPDCMFAHKLCAITDRKVIQPRDLYDAWFMFKHNFDIKEDIIIGRTGKSSKEYFTDLMRYIPKLVSKKTLLTGLGELMDQSRKDWVKDHLLEELLYELHIHAEPDTSTHTI